MTVPTISTSFIGRVRELAGIGHTVQTARLVTLTGPAGCGKTRLAMGVDDGAGNQYAGGTHWVELARLADPRFVLPAVARPLNVDESAGRSLEQGLLEVLQKIGLLLVLDNCEHLLGACNQLVESLLQTTEVCVLATSRELLGVTGVSPGPDLKRGLSPTTL